MLGYHQAVSMRLFTPWPASGTQAVLTVSDSGEPQAVTISCEGSGQHPLTIVDKLPTGIPKEESYSLPHGGKPRYLCSGRMFSKEATWGSLQHTDKHRKIL